MATGNAINANTAGIVTYNGAGVFGADTVTQHAILVGGASNGITSIALTNGQIAIGSTGADPAATTLTAGVGVSIVNAAGSITINAAGGGLAWSTVTGATQALAVNSGYVANNGGTCVMTLPTQSAVGDTIAISGINNATGWSIAVPSGQIIHYGAVATTTIGSGTLSSTLTYDAVRITCVVASSGGGNNQTWAVQSSIGNLSYT